jgi:hypothetical protein
MLDSNKDEKYPKVSLASITCIRKSHKEDESKVFNKVIVQEEEVQRPIVQYTPPHLRNSVTIRNNQDGNP